MKVTVYGFGSLNYYLHKLDVPERLGGEPPYGGSAMALEFSRAGYDTTLADPNINSKPPKILDKLNSAGVKLTDNDAEAAKDADVAIFFTPFRGGATFRIAQTALPNLAKDSVLCTTCTMSTLVLYAHMQTAILDTDRDDVGFSSMHPAAVPGTPQHKHYIIATNKLLQKPIVSDEQIERLRKLAVDAGKKAYLLPAELVSPVGDMGIVATAIGFAGVIKYYMIARDILKTRKEIAEFQTAQTFQVMASLISEYGYEGLINLLNVDAMKDSLKSMILDRDKQPMTLAAANVLDNFEKMVPELAEKAKAFKPAENVYLSVPEPDLLRYIDELVGDETLNGVLRQGLIKFYEDIEKRK